MTLNEARQDTAYTIKNIIEYDGEHHQVFTNRLTNLGLHVGEKIVLKRKAPIFRDPLLFEFYGSQIALTKKEAGYIVVEEISE